MGQTAAKNYALRRVIYDALVAAESIAAMRRSRQGFLRKECLKVSALIMARNLNAFFYHSKSNHHDDIQVADFALALWVPDPKSALTKDQQQRINKLVGHIVTSKPEPFKTSNEVSALTVPLIREVCQFMEACISAGEGQMIGNAKLCARKLNSLLPSLGLSKIAVS